MKIDIKKAKLKRKKGSNYTDWVRPEMTGHIMICCDCSLAHRINFRSLEIIKKHKDGAETGKILPRNKYKIEYKVSRSNKLTRQLVPKWN